jgi:hypothetical protein
MLDRRDRALNYLSIYAFVIVVYGGAILSDFILFELVARLLVAEIQQNGMVAHWFYLARTGLALLSIFLAVVHAIIATIRQLQLDWKLSKEGGSSS